MNRTHNKAGFTACSFEIRTDGSGVQLLPAGAFKARDGRPKDVQSGHWFLDGQSASRLITKVSARATDVVIDYEHQTLNSTDNGLPAPAAAWFKGSALEWREGQGLFVTSVDWTEKGSAFIAAKEYRYLSPVFSYDKNTGEVLDLHHVGLTNYPALDGMDSLPALAAARFEQAASDVEAGQLDAQTLAVCKAMGVTPADYIVTLKGQHRDEAIPGTPTTAEGLDTQTLAICKAMGVKPDEYLATLNG